MTIFKRLFLLVPLLLFLVPSSAAAAEAAAPGWRLTAQAIPTDLPPGGKGLIEIEAYNVGAATSNGPITVTDMLPAGVTFVAALPETEEGGAPWMCAGSSTVTCTDTEAVSGGSRVGKSIIMEVAVAPGSEGVEENVLTASGGGALEAATLRQSLTLSATPAKFGLNDLQAWATNPDGTADTQAGSHPYELGVAFDLNDFQAHPYTGKTDPNAAESEVRDIAVNLPPGLIGNPQAVPRCTRVLFDRTECPVATQVGVQDASIEGRRYEFPLYNLVPSPGLAAQFGFSLIGNDIFYDARVRSGGDYGITVDVDDIDQKVLVNSRTIIWGVPADPRHDSERGSNPGGASDAGASEAPFMTIATQCSATAPLFSVSIDAWLDPSLTSSAEYEYSHADGEQAGLTGCEHLTMTPSMAIAPDTSAADTPAGLGVDLSMPQEGLLDPEDLVQADLKDTRVVLPEGVVINPGQAPGLAACQPDEDGRGPLPNGEEDYGPASCPAASQVGTDEIESPLLAKALQGSLYVMQSEPPNLELLITASGEGVNLKLPAHVELNQKTGQLTTTVDETPAFPFTHFKLNFSGGSRAALATPTKCGTYTSETDFTPWSTPFSADVFSPSSFAIAAGSGGSACPSGVLPFTPELIAGATTDQAGGFTNFSLLLRRADDQQRIDRLQFRAPAGLTGLLSKVPLCTNAQAEANACPEASKIGHTVIESGPGPYPLVVPEQGQPPAPIYLTESYDGAPFGLAIVVPLHVGPFTLPTQKVRAKIEVDPLTGSLIVTTDPLPQEVAGVPTDLREVDSVIERPEFMLNPTDCESQEFAGTAFGAAPPGVSEPEQAAPIGSHFQVGSCRSLEFHPQLAASVSSKATRANGTSLSFKLSYPKGALGKESWLKGLKVDLPKQLPARLSTLQKSCAVATFNANPALCPAAARIGTAKVRTQLLPVPLEGPVYFVSNGSAKFPEAVFVLQGDGVMVDIHAETFINETTGITSATFDAIPDDPFEEATVTLPSGPNSEFAATGNLCATTKTVLVKKKETVKVKGRKKTVTRNVKKTIPSPLVMPTEFTGQNGAVVKQTTAIEVTGCPKAKKAKKAAVTRRKKK